MADTALLYNPTTLQTFALLTLLLPLLSFGIGALISERYAWAVTLCAPFLVLLSLISAIVVAATQWGLGTLPVAIPWFTVYGYTFSAGFMLNATSVCMLVIVSLVSFLVHVYSTGYMAGDAAGKRYFTMLGFFTFAMQGIVLADNLLSIFVFWELVGFASCTLIGHWKDKPQAIVAAKKAFLLNRVGDAGFMVGLMLVWSNTGTFGLQDMALALADQPVGGWQTAAALCIFCGVAGKSAQFPLFTWLPDAMEGPTPVSALIHAATMVAAGIFLLARMSFIFTPAALDVVAITGILTAVVAALAALSQHDIKKILAYSTISQLGLMVAAAGTGAFGVALLHLVTHAFFKACLFLSAGSVIHAVHQGQHQAHKSFDVQDMRNLGGLRKRLPFTYITFILSGSALAGIPFFSGFLSKEAIFSALIGWADNGWRWLVVVAAFGVSFLTVLYTYRMIRGIFAGDETVTADLAIAEPPVIMRAPVALLAGASVWFVFALNPFVCHGWFLQYPELPPHHTALTIFSTLWVLLALGAAGYIFRSRNPFESALLRNTFYLDSYYEKYIVRPVLAVSGVTNRFDYKWLDGMIHATAYGQVTVAHFVAWFDRVIIDGMVNGAAGLARSTGRFTRSFQGGKIQLYIFWAVLTIIIFLIWTLV